MSSRANLSSRASLSFRAQRGIAAIPIEGLAPRSGRRRSLAALGMTCALILSVAATASAQAPQREQVLQQVKVPHAYYWREMYVPQATSGPSAVTWSPDGR